MPTTNKRIKGGLPTLKLVGSISATVPGVGGTFTTSGTATAWPDGTSSRSFVVKIDSEEILCSSRSGNVFTVEERGYDDTTAATHSNDADVDHVVDGATLQAHEEYVAVGHLPLAGGTLSGEVIAADQLVTRPLLKDYGEEAQAHGATGSTETIDLENGNVHSILLDADCTLTFSNPTASGDECRLRLVVVQDGTGGWSITWPGSVEWHEASEPSLSSDPDAVDIFDFITIDGGTTWRGRRVWSEAAAASSGTSALWSRKTSPQSWTSDTTLANVTGMVVALSANKTYAFSAVIPIDGPAAGDIKLTFTVPAGASGEWQAVGPEISTTSYGATLAKFLGFASFGGGGQGFGLAGAGDGLIIVHGTVITAGTAGNLQLQAAQSTSDGTATRIQGGARLLAWEVA